MTFVPFAALCAVVAWERVIELLISRAHARKNAARGGEVVPERLFGLMALMHGAVLCAAPLEAWLRGRPPPFAITLVAACVLAVATAIRIWALSTLGDAWSVRVTRFPDGRRPVVTGGPYRHVRHPNYVAVILELAALPLLGGAWLTGCAATIANALILRRRIPLEERELERDPRYRAAMRDVPRFIPRGSRS